MREPAMTTPTILPRPEGEAPGAQTATSPSQRPPAPMHSASTPQSTDDAPPSPAPDAGPPEQGMGPSSSRLQEERGVQKSTPSLKLEGLSRPIAPPEPSQTAPSNGSRLEMTCVCRIRREPTVEAGDVVMRLEASPALPDEEGEGSSVLPAESPQ